MNKQHTLSILLATLMFLSSLVRANADQLAGADFRLHNATHSRLVAVFVVPTNVEIDDISDLKPYVVTDSDGDWTTVDPYTWIKVSVHGSACEYTIAGAFANGSYAINRNVELCNVSDFNFYE